MHVAPQTSDYPVILSLENHCSMEQQEVLAQQLKDILGEQLLTTTTDGRIPTQLPSPEVGKDFGRAGHHCPAWEWGEEVALLCRGKATPILLQWSMQGPWGHCVLTFTRVPKVVSPCPAEPEGQQGRALLPHPLLSAAGSWWCWAPAVQGSRGQQIPWRRWAPQDAYLSIHNLTGAEAQDPAEGEEDWAAGGHAGWARG